MFLRDSNSELTYSHVPQKREVSAEASKRSEKTFQEIAQEIGLKIPTERLEELKGEGKLKELFTMDEKGNVLLREGETKNKVLELLASSVRAPDPNLTTALFTENQTARDERKTNRVFFNIEQMVHQAVDAAGRDEFSKLKHHKGKVAAMTGAGVVTAAATAALRYFTGGAARFTGSLAGFVSGGYSGYARGWMRDKMAPIFERLSKGDSEKFQNIKEEKMRELLADDNILLAIEQGMRKSVLEYFNEGGETIEDFKDNAQRFIERNYKEVGKDQKETMANAMALLVDVSKQNEAMLSGLSGKEEKSVYEKIHKRLGTKGSATVIGAAMSGIGSIAGAEAAGAASGILMGGALEKWWKNKDLRERSEKAVQEVRSLAAKPIDQLTIEEVERIMGNLQAGFLEKDQFAKTEAERLLVEKTIQNEKELAGKGNIEQERKRLSEEFDHERRWHKRAAYALGIGAGVLLGGAGKVFAEGFGPKEAQVAPMPPVTTAPEHSLPEIPDISSEEEKGIVARTFGLSSSDSVDAKFLESHHLIGAKANPEDLQSVLHAAASQKIEGNVNNFTRALSRALDKIDNPGVHDNFIRKVLGEGIEVKDETRGGLLEKAVNRLSAANIEPGGKIPDVENLVYEGNILVVKENGEVDVIQGEGYKAPKVVSEDQLREGAGKGARPEPTPAAKVGEAPPLPETKAPPTPPEEVVKPVEVKPEAPAIKPSELAENPLLDNAFEKDATEPFYRTKLANEDIPGGVALPPDTEIYGVVSEEDYQKGIRRPPVYGIRVHGELAEGIREDPAKSIGENIKEVATASHIIKVNVENGAKALAVTPPEYLQLTHKIGDALGADIVNHAESTYDPTPIKEFYEFSKANPSRAAEALTFAGGLENIAPQHKLDIATLLINPHLKSTYWERENILHLEGTLKGKASSIDVDFARDEIDVHRKWYQTSKRYTGVDASLNTVIKEYIKP